MDKIKAAEEMYPGWDGLDLIKRQTFIAGWDAALSTQSPKWVKASERLWDYGKKVIVRYNNEVHYTQYHNITYCVPIELIEWLDESPPSTHPLQEKIDAMTDEISLLKGYVDSLKRDIVKMKDSPKTGFY